MIENPYGKFEKRTPKIPWTVEQTEQRIAQSWDDIATFNQLMNDIDSRCSNLIEQKRIIRQKIGNKQKYIAQLVKQIEEIKLNREQNVK